MKLCLAIESFLSFMDSRQIIPFHYFSEFYFVEHTKRLLIDIAQFSHWFWFIIAQQVTLIQFFN